MLMDINRGRGGEREMNLKETQRMLSSSVEILFYFIFNCLAVNLVTIISRTCEENTHPVGQSGRKVLQYVQDVRHQCLPMDFNRSRKEGDGLTRSHTEHATRISQDSMENLSVISSNNQ